MKNIATVILGVSSMYFLCMTANENADHMNFIGLFMFGVCLWLLAKNLKDRLLNLKFIDDIIIFFKL